MLTTLLYYLYCMGMVISASFGNVPEELTWKTGIIGVLTTIVLLLSAYGIAWMICFTINRVKRNRMP